MVKLSTAAAALFLLVSNSNGFSNRYTQIGRRQMHTSMAALPSPEESAKAMSDYMAKSHEDKLRAVKAAEDKSASTIKVSGVLI